MNTTEKNRLSLLVDAPDFWDAFRRDALSATENIRIQTLSFEGDRVGWQLAELLQSLSPAVSRRILVDNFTRYIINDKFQFLPGNYLNEALKKERLSTRQMIRELRENQVEVQFTSPVGALLHRFAARNHKKLLSVDERVAYIGGINFSEHNFAWHDMMLRICDPEIVRFLNEDFENTWQNNIVFDHGKFPGIELLSLSGRGNENAFQKVFEVIDRARESIWVKSPYITFPFVEHLAAARKRGVSVHVVTPELNNRTFLKEYIIWAGNKNGFQLHFFQDRMSHLKAMLVDDCCLIMGSTNFDYLSYRIHPEYVAFVSETSVLEDFRQKVLEPALKRSSQNSHQVSDMRGNYLRIRSLLLGKFFIGLANLTE
ncbi:MAG: phosphatidylserine/phosphatidylglycerophosphate/cardiolipin synthase family protein [Calditrichia bacterium]